MRAFFRLISTYFLIVLVHMGIPADTASDQHFDHTCADYESVLKRTAHSYGAGVCRQKLSALRSEAYSAAKLNEQLDDQSHRFLASPAGLTIDESARIVYPPSIFKWYGEVCARIYHRGRLQGAR